MGNVCINYLNEEFAIAQRTICLRPYAQSSSVYFKLAIMSTKVQNLIKEHSTGMTAKGIKAAKLKPLPLPIPPVEEQKRIATKVDELMSLCDQLEASLENETAIKADLLKSLIV